MDEAGFLRRLFAAAIAAADPRVAVPPALPPRPAGRCVVVGAGKASAAMAAAVDAAWPDAALSGVVATRYGHAAQAGRIQVLQAAHPVPDAASETAARAMLAAVAGLTADDLVLALISGGGSAIAALPAPGLTLADKQAVTRRLLASGAPISDINAVRRALSAFKGGRLAAAAAPAQVVTLAISDIPGDDPAIIASGPTVPDGTSWADVTAILRRHQIVLPAGFTPLPPLTPWLADIRLIATPGMALAAAARAARREGVTPVILGDAIEGEARVVGRAMAEQALAYRRDVAKAGPCVLLSGGETTVTLSASAGAGGRNTEFLLALALALDGAPGIWALACDTDGIDGVSPAAGALAGPRTLAQARAAGCDPVAALAAHDSLAAFTAAGTAIVTGPTLTNVNDFRAILVS